MQKTWNPGLWSLGQEDLLEEEMTTHSSILACRIPWTEEPGGLPSMRLQRVGYNWVNNTYILLYLLLYYFLIEGKKIRVLCAVKQRGLFLAIFRDVQKTCEVERLNKRFSVFCLYFVITFCCICLCLVFLNSIYLNVRLEYSNTFFNICHIVAAVKTIIKTI